MLTYQLSCWFQNLERGRPLTGEGMGDIGGIPYLYASPFKIGPSLDPLPAKSISMDRPYKVTKELNSIFFFFFISRYQTRFRLSARRTLDEGCNDGSPWYCWSSASACSPSRAPPEAAPCGTLTNTAIFHLQFIILNGNTPNKRWKINSFDCYSWIRKIFFVLKVSVTVRFQYIQIIQD